MRDRLAKRSVREQNEKKEEKREVKSCARSGDASGS